MSAPTTPSPWPVELPPGVEIVARWRIPGEPVSKQRPRLGQSRVYTPAKTRAAENEVAWRFRCSTRGHIVNATSTYGVAAVFVHKRRTNRDEDNMLKLVKDALNGVAYVDDGQVTQSVATKVWDPTVEPYTDVVLYRTQHPRPTPAATRKHR